MTPEARRHRNSCEAVILLLGSLSLAFIGVVVSTQTDDVDFADMLRVTGFVIAAMIFGAWGVIMGRSLRDYLHARRSGKDVDLRLHIWLITTSYLIYVAADAYRMLTLVGEPLRPDAAPTMLVAGPIGLFALWLFLRPARRCTIKPDDRTTTVAEQ